ncbi:MAG: hydrogenase iron-sulfur subunit [Chloroflexi bacterium]|nr:hydrogenase iron-sulfur subunit [Chloroflexota bacterium]
MSDLEPKVVAYICNWGAYSALDAAGVGQVAYPIGVRLLRLPCVGNVNVASILEAFQMGADGVMLLSCAKGRCHYLSSEDKSASTLAEAREIIETLGIDARRLRQVQVQDADGEALSRAIRDFVESLRIVGPSLLALNEKANVAQGLVVD